MAEFSSKSRRLTPYPNFHFKVSWGGNYVAGVSKIGALTRQTQVMRHRNGGEPAMVHLAPGQTEYGPIIMERGVSYDPAFEQWANQAFDLANSRGNNATALADFRKDLIIEVYDEAGRVVLSYNVYRAWVSELTAMSELDANGNSFVIQSITVQNEGWERDFKVKEPPENSFTVPSNG
jgi:phage tail-like protein